MASSSSCLRAGPWHLAGGTWRPGAQGRRTGRRIELWVWRHQKLEPSSAVLQAVANQMCVSGMRLQCQYSRRLPSVSYSTVLNAQPSQRIRQKDCCSLQAAFPAQYTEKLTQSAVSFKDFCVSAWTEENCLIKMQVNVSGTMTDSIFEKVFTKNVAAAQPLPGFCRLKGGKTPKIPREVALHIIGPSKVKKETIKKIINCTVVEYVRKEGLTASKDLKVEQSYEELEALFEPGKEFCFGATFHLE